MSSNKQWVKIEDRTLNISNLEKILFPDDKISKAQIIEYYLTIAPVILRHVKGRPLTLIRYPDGIDKEQFYQKNIPGWAPDWIDTVRLGEEEDINYVLATESASLIWLANLASLELHQMHVRKPNYESPDYMVFDLDPPDDSDFGAVKKIALSLKTHVEQFGYNPFVKTSGKKGLHLFLPLTVKAGMNEVYEASKLMAQDFVDQHEGITLQIKKKARKGRMLIDIYRNRTHQTIVSPYSLRAVLGAPVSMPIHWEELPDIATASDFTLPKALKRLEQKGDVWEKIRDYATPLHTDDSPVQSSKELPASPHHKSPEQLNEYRKKRDFSKTSEPDSDGPMGEGNRFVVQRHHASRLHYDLRLERDGVLRSWAVPKGLPPHPGVKRLAVETEDHPLEYLDFEGEIPKGEYGGGKMWIYARGRYEMTKEKEGGLHFRLESDALRGAFRMYRTEKNQWLIERVDEPQINWLRDRVEVMNAERVDEVPAGDYGYEVKWDGIRALIALEAGEITIHTRNQNEITDKFPELQDASGLRASAGLFDGEIVYLDKNGRPSFQKIINRLKRSSVSKNKKSGSVYCYLFDCLYLDGRALIDEPLKRRREWLEDVVKRGHVFRISEMLNDGEGLLKAAREQGLEGIMAKKLDSTYQPGTRSNKWLKVKIETTADCYIIGYTKGNGDRSAYFGALHMAEETEEGLQYRGKVGTGFNQSSLEEIYEALMVLDEIDKPIDHEVEKESGTTWVDPKVVIEVSYGRLTDDGIFRESVFKRLRPDLSG